VVVGLGKGVVVELKEWLLECEGGAYSWGTMRQSFSGVHLAGLSVTVCAYDKEVGGSEPLCMVSEEYMEDLNAGLDTYQSFGDVGHDDGRYGTLVEVASDCVVWLAWNEEEEDFYYDVFVVTAVGRELTEEQRLAFSGDPDPVPGISPAAISMAIEAWVRQVTTRSDLSFYYDDDYVPQMYLNVAAALLAIENGDVELFDLGDGVSVNGAFFDAVALLGVEEAAELVKDLRLEMQKMRGS
jgi:hypothetical protein